ncbi:hypothetical protein ACS0TY_019030 [Phlomoides rotata]
MNLYTSSFALFAYSATHRVSTLHSISRFSCSPKSSGGSRSWSRSSCLIFCDLKLRGVFEAVVEKKSSFSSTATAPVVVASGSAYNQDEIVMEILCR